MTRPQAVATVLAIIALIVLWAVLVAVGRRRDDGCDRCRYWYLVPCTCEKTCPSAACEYGRRRGPQ